MCEIVRFWLSWTIEFVVCIWARLFLNVLVSNIFEFGLGICWRWIQPKNLQLSWWPFNGHVDSIQEDFFCKLLENGGNLHSTILDRGNHFKIVFNFSRLFYIDSFGLWSCGLYGWTEFGYNWNNRSNRTTLVRSGFGFEFRNPNSTEPNRISHSMYHPIQILFTESCSS